MCDIETFADLAAANDRLLKVAALGFDGLLHGEGEDSFEMAVMGVCSRAAEREKAACGNPEPMPAEASGTEVACSGVPSTETGASDADAAHPESESGTGFALSVSNTKANPKVQISYPKPKPYPKPKTEGRTA